MMRQRCGGPLNATIGWRLPIPATYVIGPDRPAAASFANADYRYRMGPEDITAALREVTSPVS